MSAPPSWRSAVAARFAVHVRAGAAVTLMLLIQVGLFAWMAPRGFEFSDESFYLVSLLHWRWFMTNFTFFGVYFEWPFRLLGQDIGLIRLFGYALMLACSAYACTGVLAYADRRLSRQRAVAPRWAFVAVAMAAVPMYYGYMPMFRVPSYNLAALCSALLATGVLLRVVSAEEPWRRTKLLMVSYGIAIGACLLSKITGALMIATIHFAFVLYAADRGWKRANLTAMVVLAVTGVALNVALLSWLLPQWPQVLERGVLLMKTTSGERGVLRLFSFIGNDLPTVAGRFGPAGAVVAAAYIVTRRFALGRGWAGAARWIDASLIVAFGLALTLRPTRHAWLLALVLVVGLLLWRAVPGRDRGLIALVVMLMVSVPALSIGTDLPVLAHSEINAVFAFLALLLLLYWIHAGQAASTSVTDAVDSTPALVPRATAAAMLALTLPGIAVLMHSLGRLDPQFLFRQRVALIEQHEPVTIGAAPRPVRVDPATKLLLQQLSSTAAAHGWTSGAATVDLTGMGPGMSFALGARPLGVAWLFGEYSAGSRRGAALALSWIDPDALCSAWLLTSTLSPLRIDGWQLMMRSRTGRDCHEPVATLATPGWREVYGRVEPMLDVTVWRPKPPAARSMPP